MSDQPNTALRPHQTAIVAAILAAALAWVVPVLQPFLLPLLYLNTHLHELAHAIAGVATGGTPDYIHVYANGSGVTPTRGGNVLALASAGYLGAALMGAAMIYFGRTERGAHTVLRVIAVMLAIGMVLWVKGDTVGVISGIGWVVVLFGLSRFGKGMPLLFATQFLGLQQCLNAIQSVYMLLKISAFTSGHSDAMILQQHTRVPAIVWATLWCAFSLLMIGLTLRKAWREPIRGTGSPAAGQ
jgi:hypothetical protein